MAVLSTSQQLKKAKRTTPISTSSTIKQRTASGQTVDSGLAPLSKLSGTSEPVQKTGTVPSSDIKPTAEAPQVQRTGVTQPVEDTVISGKTVTGKTQQTGVKEGTGTKAITCSAGYEPDYSFNPPQCVKVGTSKQTTNLAPTTEGDTEEVPDQPEAIQSEIDSIQSQEDSDINEIQSLTDANINAETDYKNTMTQLAENKYETEQNNLDRMETLQAETLRLRNEMISAVSEQQRRDAQAAYDKNVREMEIQRERTKNAYNQQIVDQQLANTKRTLEMENYIAATGGFGSLIKNNQMMDLTMNNDRLLNSVKFEADMADREISSEITSITDEYQNDLFEIETTKMTAINSAYSEYLEYVTEIQNDREKTEDEKFEAIQTAQADYKKNVAQINQTSFEARYNVSQTAAEQVRDMKFRQVDTNVSAVLGYASDANGNPILDEYGQKIEIPKESQSNYEYVEPQYDAYGRMTSPGGSFDPSTGQFTPDLSIGVPSDVRQSGGVNYSTPEVKSYLEDIFGVGQVGGWCGVYSSTISTASPVGDTYKEKMTHVVPGEVPSAGDKLILPLGVTDKDQGYGHVATVIGYNEATGDIYVVESNADGRQNKGNGEGVVTLGTYNINTLNTKYGEQSYGFVPGELKEPYKSSVEGIEMTFGTSMYGGGGTDLASLDAESDQYGLTGEAKAKYMQSRASGMSPDEALSSAFSQSGEEATSENFDQITKLQTQYKPLVQELRTLEEGYATASNFDVKTKNIYSDQALIFAFMKILDPTSVVREGEYATALNNASVLDTLSNQWKKAVAGEGLLKEEQRKNLLKEMERIYNQKRGIYEKEMQQATTVGEMFGIDPNLYLSGYDLPDSSATQDTGTVPSPSSVGGSTGGESNVDISSLSPQVQQMVQNGTLTPEQAIKYSNK